MNGTLAPLFTSEVRKILTLKFWWGLLIAPVVIGAFASAIYASISADATVAELGIDEQISVVGLFVTIAATMLFASVFGAVNAGGEMRHRTITTSFLSSSGRLGILVAKLAVTALFGAAYALIAQTFSVLSMLLFGIGTFRITGFVVGVFLIGIVVTMAWCVIGAGLGLLFGSPTWAAVALVAWMPVGELITVGILNGIDIQPVSQILPGMATISFLAAGNIAADDPFLSSGVGALVLLLWSAAIGTLGIVAAARRDIT